VEHRADWENQRVTDSVDMAEVALLGRIAQGDRQALADLYLRYRLPLFQYLLQFTPDRGLAEELLQDTFMAVWKGASSFQGRSRVRAWLFGIARRRACKKLRYSDPPLADVTELELRAAEDSEPETMLARRLARDELLAAMRRLTPDHREVLLLTFEYQLSYQELADVLQVPMGTVKSRLSNAKRALRALLSGGEEASQ
jgi:RNA polymerase sigma-70 factor, ECF subfamily